MSAEVSYKVEDYFQARDTIHGFEKRAFEVYRAIDPSHRLLGPFGAVMNLTINQFDDGYVGVFLDFGTYDGQKGSRIAVFPFEVMNWNLEDKDYILRHLSMGEQEYVGPDGRKMIYLEFKVNKETT